MASLVAGAPGPDRPAVPTRRDLGPASRSRPVGTAADAAGMLVGTVSCPVRRVRVTEVTDVVNRLASATSPYLLQHADNPVDWWEWGPEPFEEARRREVPVLLSVGYAACHWCHVMAHESFEDEATAA